MAQATVDYDIVTPLRVDNQGWNVRIFQNQHSLKSFICFQCKGVCCDAVELGCDHDDNDIFLYCSSCLEQLVKDNNNKCPIDQHNDPMIVPNRALRRQIWKSMTYCPYSTAYKSQISFNKYNDNGHIADTLRDDFDQKVSGCQWKGTLKDLTHKHLSVCMQTNEPLYSLRATVKDLQRENKQLKKQITQLHKTQNANYWLLIYDRYKTQTNGLQNKLMKQYNDLKQLMNKNKELQNEVEFQRFQNNKLKQENKELKIQMPASQNKKNSNYDPDFMYAPQLKQLLDMGFDETKSKQLLLKNRGNMSQVIATHCAMRTVARPKKWYKEFQKQQQKPNHVDNI